MVLCVCVLLCMTVPSTTRIPMHRTNSTLFTAVTSSPIIGDGDTLYVGGSGPDNYTSIQAAVNDANDGDTVFVYDDMSPYQENVAVEEAIRLVGEDSETTVIDGGGQGDVISVWADNVTIQDLTIQNGGAGCGIYALANNSHFHDNVLRNNEIGIWLERGKANNISDNKIDNSQKNASYGIQLGGNNNTISHNTISNNIIGINVIGKHIRVMRNTITMNRWGVFVTRWTTEWPNNGAFRGGFNQIHYNNFIQNRFHAGFEWKDSYKVWDTMHIADWSNNYWSGWLGILPKPVIGFGDCIDNYVPEMILFNCDWHPAREPIEWRSS